MAHNSVPCSAISRIINKLQRIIWMDFIEPLWQNCNELLHQQKNNYKRVEDAALTKQLELYQSNQHTLLAHHDHFVLHNNHMPTLHTMPSRQKWVWIQHLMTAKLANAQELTLKKTNQHSLCRYMKPVNANPLAQTTENLPPQDKSEIDSKVILMGHEIMKLL